MQLTSFFVIVDPILNPFIRAKHLVRAMHKAARHERVVN